MLFAIAGAAWLAVAATAADNSVLSVREENEAVALQIDSSQGAERCRAVAAIYGYVCLSARLLY